MRFVNGEPLDLSPRPFCRHQGCRIGLIGTKVVPSRDEKHIEKHIENQRGFLQINVAVRNVTIAHGAITDFQETTASVDSEIPTVA